ncbi:MAG: class E sortase [Actinobacteria bacterium]|nr:class E sortase [Actinomycetota bacterium]
MRKLTRTAALLAGLAVVLTAAMPVAGCGGGRGGQGGQGATINLQGIKNLSGSVSHLEARLSQKAVYFPAKKYLAALAAGSHIGQIEIPRLGVYEWVVEGTTSEILEKGAGHIGGTTVPGLGGNFAVAGDRVLYSAPFLRLEQLAPGDQVLAHMPYGDFSYLVESKTNVPPTEVSVLNPKGYDSITLSTCDPPWDMQTRIIISGRLAGVELRDGNGPGLASNSART